MGKLIIVASALLLLAVGGWAAFDYFKPPAAATDETVSPLSILAGNQANADTKPADAKQLLDRVTALVTKGAIKGNSGSVTVELTMYSEEYLTAKAAVQAEADKKDAKSLLSEYQNSLETDRFMAFAVAMNTHSGDLNSYNLQKSSVLRDDRGNEVNAVNWQEDKGSQSHHRSGTLFFPKNKADGQPAVASDAKYLEITVRDVAGVKERVFRWDLPIPYPPAP